MSRLELISYIKQNLKARFSRKEIRNALSSAGWNKDDIEMAFSYVDAGRRRLFGLLAVVIITPLLGFGSAWLYSKYEAGAPVAQTPSSETGIVAGVTVESKEEIKVRDQQRIADIKTLQEILDKFSSLTSAIPKI